MAEPSRTEYSLAMIMPHDSPSCADLPLPRFARVTSRSLCTTTGNPASQPSSSSCSISVLSFSLHSPRHCYFFLPPVYYTPPPSTRFASLFSPLSRSPFVTININSSHSPRVVPFSFQVLPHTPIAHSLCQLPYPFISTDSRISSQFLCAKFHEFGCDCPVVRRARAHRRQNLPIIIQKV